MARLHCANCPDPLCENIFSFEHPVLTEEAIFQLTSYTGLDESTANYIAMRALGEPERFL